MAYSYQSQHFCIIVEQNPYQNGVLKKLLTFVTKTIKIEIHIIGYTLYIQELYCKWSKWDNGRRKI